jgi:glutathione peroxidase
MMLKGIAFALMLASGSFAASSVYDFTLKSIDGKEAPLAAYKGKVMLLINVASQCGYTPQYAGLQSLYTKYKDRGLVVVGVPANNFGGQEPGNDSEIKTFCTRNYGVTFPMMSKVSVKGSDIAPLYQYLISTPGMSGDIQWNFTKFVIGKDGKPVARFAPSTKPDAPELLKAIDEALSR